MINETRGHLFSILAALVWMTPGAVRAQTADHMAGRPEAHWESVSQCYGLDRRVFDTMEFEGDLILAGEFNAAGDVVLHHVARWDGAEWHSLGAGFNHPVRCLGTFQGDLIAGGLFTESGGRPMAHVARWSGTEWEPMGEGFDGSPTSFAEWEGHLVAGGWFSHGGDHSWFSQGADLPYAAEWDGTHWSAMGQVADGTALSAPPRDLIVYGGSLFAAGSFSSHPLSHLMARWDGSAWIPTGPVVQADQGGRKPFASCFAIWDSLLIVGGNFTSLDSETARKVIVFNGETWTPIGTDQLPEILDIEIHEGRLFVSGFNHNGPGIAAWDGNIWTSVSENLASVRTISSLNGLLYASTDLAEDQVEVWDGNIWSGLPAPHHNSIITEPIVSLMSYDNKVLSLSNWTYTWVNVEDRIQAPNHGRWLHDHHAAQPEWDFYATYCSTRFRGSLFLGFQTWNGVTSGAIPRPESFWGPTALTTFEDRLIAAQYPASCPYAHNQILAWDGTSWSPFADGLCMSQMGEWEWERWGIVRALSSYRGQLVAGGLFAYNDNVHHNLGAWTGAAWAPLGDCPNDLVTCLLEYNGDLIAAGFFDHVGQVAASGIARWDGSRWHSLGLGTDGPVYTMVIHNDRLIVGGYFRNAGGLPAGSIAAWDGSGWLQLGSGVDGEVLTMASNMGTLWVGGEFSRADGQTSFHLAKWMEGPRTATFSSFTAQRRPNGVLVEASASYLPFGHQGFLVYRQAPDEVAVVLTSTPIEGGEMSFTDASPPLGPVTYSIAGVASTGSVTEYASTQVAADPSLRFALLPSKPNPFQNGTSISFQNAQAGRIQISVFDLQGRCVARIVDRSFSPGAHSVSWNGRDTSGRAVSAGTYFCRITSPEGTRVQSLVKSAF